MLKSFSPSEDIYIYMFVFFSSPSQVETKLKKKILGTNGYINMILFVKIKNFLVTCISVLNKLLGSIVWGGKSLPFLFSLY